MLDKIYSWLGQLTCTLIAHTPTAKSNSLDVYFNDIDKKMSTLIAKCEELEIKIDDEMFKLKKEVNFYKSMLHTIANTIPDMMWCKDNEGKYIYANTAIKENLLFSNDVIGKTDIELANAAKLKYGDENHTFGEKCANSDDIVKESLKAQRFLESGKLKGKMVYLEVFKAPLIINGVLVGVVGTGRDLTEYVESFRHAGCNSCHKADDIFKRYEFG